MNAIIYTTTLLSREYYNLNQQFSGYVLFKGLTTPVRASQNNAEPLKALGLDEFPPRVSLPITVSF